MKYRPIIDIWTLSEIERHLLQPGQWVRAGRDGPIGQFLGAGRSIVVAWRQNARRGRYRSYIRSLRDYAISIKT